jgi:hypothetical protein
VARAGEVHESWMLALVVTFDARHAAFTLRASAIVRVIGLAQ